MQNRFSDFLLLAREDGVGLSLSLTSKLVVGAVFLAMAGVVAWLVTRKSPHDS